MLYLCLAHMLTWNYDKDMDQLTRVNYLFERNPKISFPAVRGWLASASEADLSNMFEDNDVLLVALTLTVTTVCRPIN